MRINARFTIGYSLAVWLSCSSSLLVLAQESPGTAAFKRLDKNGDGKITRDEAPSAQSFANADTDRDDIVTPEEYRNVLRRQPSEPSPSAFEVSQPAQADESARKLTNAVQIETGYVFINGDYIPPPYLIEEANGLLTVNHIPVSGKSPQSANAKYLSLKRRIQTRLSNDSIIVSFEDQSLTIFDAGRAVDFLRVIIRPNYHAEAFQRVIATLRSEDDRQLWTDWLTSYKPSQDLKERATARVQAADALEAANLAEIAAVHRIEAISYPLTMLGMVVAMVASGHLITSPPTRAEAQPIGTANMLSGGVLISIALIFVLSALDLAWTVLAAQAGQMRELNPVGYHLVKDPARLIAFKSVATVIACALLLVLRRHYTARLAAWWLCLVCTLLTFRWISFNSLFMGA